MKFMNRLRRILLIINYKTLIITALSIASTYLCLRYEWVADFPLTLIATAIVFPIVFSIGSQTARDGTEELRRYQGQRPFPLSIHAGLAGGWQSGVDCQGACLAARIHDRLQDPVDRTGGEAARE